MEFCTEIFWKFFASIGNLVGGVLIKQHCQNSKKNMMEIAKELHEIWRSPESRIYILAFAKYIFDYNM